jgi:hypothetical protein
MAASQTGQATLEEAVAVQAAPSAAERPAYFPDGFPTIDAPVEPHIESF